MSTLVKVKVQPGQTVNFPGRCVHTGAPAMTTMPIRARRGQQTRQIAVPIGAAAAQLLAAQSAAEARFRVAGRIVIGVLAFALLLFFILALPPLVPVIVRFVVGLIIASFLAFALWRAVTQTSLRFADPAKKDLLKAVRIQAFSWRATTFAFARADYAEAFRQLNAPYVMAPP